MSQSCCEQHLHTIRKHALYHTRERVEYGCSLAIVHSKSVTYTTGDISYGEYGYSIVGGTEIDHAHHGRN